MSTWPKRESVCSTNRVTSAARVTSVGTASASGPSAAASAESRSPERAERTTRAPQRASAWAVARPMPELAPVTMATFPASGWLMVSLSAAAAALLGVKVTRQRAGASVHVSAGRAGTGGKGR